MVKKIFFFIYKKEHKKGEIISILLYNLQNHITSVKEKKTCVF